MVTIVYVSIMVNLLVLSLQVACTWDDIKSLRQDIDKSMSEGKVRFRGKLLQAISLMQVCILMSYLIKAFRGRITKLELFPFETNVVFLLKGQRRRERYVL